MTGTPDLGQMKAALDSLRGNHKLWAEARRLAIFAKCCKEEPLIQVMDTTPPCVLLGQPDYTRTKSDDAERKPWSGVRRGEGQGIVWLASFEQMAERGVPQYVWCQHRRWAIPASDVFATRGRRYITP